MAEVFAHIYQSVASSKSASIDRKHAALQQRYGEDKREGEVDQQPTKEEKKTTTHFRAHICFIHVEQGHNQYAGPIILQRSRVNCGMCKTVASR